MKETEMKQIADWIVEVIKHTTVEKLPVDKKARLAFIKKFKKDAQQDKVLLAIRKKVTKFANKYPLFSW